MPQYLADILLTPQTNEASDIMMNYWGESTYTSNEYMEMLREKDKKGKEATELKQKRKEERELKRIEREKEHESKRKEQEEKRKVVPSYTTNIYSSVVLVRGICS